MPKFLSIIQYMGPVVCLGLVTAAWADVPDYQNAGLPFEKRVADLVGRMTLAEKAANIQSFNYAVNRAGLTLPATCWYTEAGHGAYPGRDFGPGLSATSFPIPLAMAASWDPALLGRTADAIGDETRVRMDPAGSKWRGIIVFSPMINLARDPRWGRTQECYGEDPWLAGQMGLAFIKGVQGNDPKYLKTAALVKHFAMNSQEAGRLDHSFEVSQRALREYYFPAFETCLGQAAGVMSAYNGINKVPCAANSWLLTDVLRDEWNFSGPVITDYRAVGYLRNRFHFPGAETDPQAVAVALNAGVDVIADERSGGWDTAIIQAVNQGLVKPETLDRALSRDLMIRMRLGYFDPPGQVPFTRIPESVVGSPAHLELARQIAREGMVLLKNDPPSRGAGLSQLLPLDLRRISSIAVIGPFAGVTQYGDYSPPPAGQALTPLQAIAAAVGERVTVHAADSGSPEDAARAAASSDVAIFIGGLTPNMEHEGIDRPNIDVFEDARGQLTPQGKMLEAVVAANPATILVLEGGGAIGLGWAKAHCPAIVMSWYPGEQGGPALADVLLGAYNPAGRLPVTFYRSADDLPPMDDYEVTHGRTYMYLPPEKAAVFPFGHGLSYTRFTYANLQISSLRDGAAKTFSVRFDVTNAGAVDGDEVVQLYIHKRETTFARPIKQLKGFEHLTLPRGQTQNVQLPLPAAELAYWDQDKHAFITEPGDYDILVGSSSEDIRLRGTITIR